MRSPWTHAIAYVWHPFVRRLGSFSAASTQTATVDYLSSNGTAKAGSDYSVDSVVFAPGQTSKSISIPIVNDLNDEPNEIFTLTLSNPGNARLGTPTSTTVTITDDDAPPPSPGRARASASARARAAASGRGGVGSGYSNRSIVWPTCNTCPRRTATRAVTRWPLR
ncbi:MAG TPA: Calx-beta domain-containing protein [Roseiflexaceae bacterium]